jgi:hypothetical protein
VREERKREKEEREKEIEKNRARDKEQEREKKRAREHRNGATGTRKKAGEKLSSARAKQRGVHST